MIIIKQAFLLLISILATILVSSCSSGDNSSDVSIGAKIIGIDPNSQRNGKILLSDIIDSITYIPLETNENFMLGTIRKNFICSENYILFDNTDYKKYLFSRSGKYIAQIGNVGAGPGEYLYYGTHKAHIDEKNSQVIIVTSYPRRSMYYDFNGKFLKSIPLPFENLIGDIEYYNSNIYNFYLVKESNMGKVPYTYTVLDTAFNIITQKIKPVQFSRKLESFGVSAIPLFSQYMYNNQVHIMENMLNDTLYMVNDDFTFVPKYIFNSGKYGVTADIRGDNGIRFLQKSNDCVMLYSMFETDDNLFILYEYQGKSIPICFNKKENKVVRITASSSGIPNDYDGGLDFWPQYQNNKQLIAFYDAHKLIEHKKNANKYNLKGSEESLFRFDKMVSNLESDDNPVIVIVKLK